MIIIASVAILTIGGVMFYKINTHHQANKLIIEKCFENLDNGGTVVIEKKNLWSPVSCVKE